jgi:hypothetical protein
VNALPNELPVELVRAWRVLDADAARRAARVDAQAVASRVVARLREDAEPAVLPRVRPGRWTLPAMPGWARVTAAAAMVVVVAGSVVLGVLRSGGDRAVAVPVGAVALDSLNAQELETLLRVTADVRPVPTAAEPVAGSWDDLSESQLRAVLQAMQQVQGETL